MEPDVGARGRNVRGGNRQERRHLTRLGRQDDLRRTATCWTSGLATRGAKVVKARWCVCAPGRRRCPRSPAHLASGVARKRAGLGETVVRARRPHPARMGPAIAGTTTSLWAGQGCSACTTTAACPRPSTSQLGRHDRCKPAARPPTRREFNMSATTLDASGFPTTSSPSRRTSTPTPSPTSARCAAGRRLGGPQGGRPQPQGRRPRARGNSSSAS